MTLLIRHATSSDADLLSKLGATLFRQTFGHLYSHEDLDYFLTTSHSENRVIDDLAAGSSYAIAFYNSLPVGYIKYGYNGLPITLGHGRQFEIKQLYLDHHHQRKHIGQELIDLAHQEFTLTDSDVVFVGVWSKNFLAQKFYARNGYKEIAGYWFPVGKTIDRELIMVRAHHSIFD